MRSIILCIGIALTWLSAASGCEPALPTASRTSGGGLIRGAAGAAMLPYAEAALAAFRGLHPNIEAAMSEARSSAAIQKLIDGELDLAFTSRAVRPSDLEAADKKHRQLHMVTIAAEAVAVVVHPDNPVRDISADQLRDVFFTGSISDWSQLTHGEKQGPIKVVAVNPKSSGTGDLFVTTIAGDSKPQYVASAEMVDYSDDTIAKVAQDPNAISFSGMGNVDQRVKALTINQVVPTEKTILDTSYVLNRKLFVISDGPPKRASRELVKFMLSDRGQRIAREKGVTPIVLD